METPNANKPPETKQSDAQGEGGAGSEGSEASSPAAADAKEDGKGKIRFTSKIRRGLALVRVILNNSFDDTKAPSEQTTKKWTVKDRTEFNAAMEWLEQEEDKATATKHGQD